MLKKIIFVLFLLPLSLFAQTMDFNEFLDLGKNILDGDKAKAIQQYLPGRFQITAADFGDMTGDGRTDFAIAVRPQVKFFKKIIIYLFCDSTGSYVPFYSDTLNYFELPIEIGFSIDKNVCYVTQKLKDRSWTITGYSFYKNEFTLVDFYKTDVNNTIKKLPVGEEQYGNYRNLQSFSGYFDLNSLRQYRKNSFFVHPVYDLKRNIYSGYRRTIRIDEKWMWGDSLLPHNDYGSIVFNRDSSYLAITLRLNDLSGFQPDSISFNTAVFCFDRTGQRLLPDYSKKGPRFRTAEDDDIGRIKVFFSLKDPSQARVEYKLGGNFNQALTSAIKLSYVNGRQLTYRLRIPLALLNIPEGQTEFGNFTQLTLKLNEGEVILKNSDSYAENPSGYARLVMIEKGSYYGVLSNSKFSEVINIMAENGIINRK